MGYFVLLALWILKANGCVITTAMWWTVGSYTVIEELIALVKLYTTKL